MLRALPLNRKTGGSKPPHAHAVVRITQPISSDAQRSSGRPWAGRSPGRGALRGCSALPGCPGPAGERRTAARELRGGAAGRLWRVQTCDPSRGRRSRGATPCTPQTTAAAPLSSLALSPTLAHSPYCRPALHRWTGRKRWESRPPRRYGRCTSCPAATASPRRRTLRSSTAPPMAARPGPTSSLAPLGSHSSAPG